MNIVHPSLQFFQEPLEDKSIESKHMQVYNPNDIAPGLTTKTRYEIQVAGQSAFINFGEAVLECSVKVVSNAAGAGLAAGDHTALQNGVWSLFERAQLQVGSGSSIIEEVNFCNIANHMKYLISSTDDKLRTEGGNLGVFLDEGLTGAAEDNPADAVYNRGFATRMTQAAADAGGNAKLITFYAPLKYLFGYCQESRVTRNLKHTIILNRASHNNMIHRNAAAAAALVSFQRVRVWCPTVVPSLEIIQRYENSMLQGYSQKINFESMNCYRSGVFPATDLTPVFKVTTSIQNPTHILIAIQNSATDNNQEANNQVFLTSAVTEMEVRLNQTQLPRERLTTDYADSNENYGRAYQMFLDYKKDFGANSLVSKTDFKNLYNIYHIDTTTAEPMVFNNDGGGNSSCDVEVRLRRNAGQTAIHIYALIFSDQECVVTGTSGEVRIEKL